MADTHIKIKPVTPRVQYTANGSTTVFPYSFAIFDETDMVVYVDDAIITTGYTVSGAGQTDGGNVTFDTAPVDGTIITLLRNVPIERMTDFQEGGTFRPKNINDEFDRQTAFAQQVQEALGRCVKVDPTSESNPEEILPKIERLYDSADNIDIVANDKANVDAVAENKTNIDAVAGNNAEISAVAGIASDVSTVAGNTTDISNVATNMSDVNDCAANIEAIQAAPSAASSAATSAQQAAISAAGTHLKLFHHDWFDYQLNDMAWLRADTFSWQDGTVYSEAYNHLVEDMVGISPVWETVGSYQVAVYNCADGHKVCTPDQETNVANIYTESGVAWYYILDTANQRFKLPRENPAREVLGQSAAVIGNGKALGLKQGIDSYDVYLGVGSTNNQDLLRGYATTSDTSTGAAFASAGSAANQLIGVTQDSTKSGLVADLSETTGIYKGKKYLYFYIGQFSQSATEQTAGINTELFNGKMDLDLGNATQVTKDTIVGWAMPDYSSAVSFSSSIAAPYDCMIECGITSAHNSGWVSIDGVSRQLGNGRDDSHDMWYTAYVPKGITIQSSGCNVSRYYKLKGV